MKTGYRVLKATRSRQPQSTVSYTAGTIGEVNETQAEIVWDDKEVTVSLNIEENDLFLLDNAASGKPRYFCKYNISSRLHVPSPCFGTCYRCSHYRIVPVYFLTFLDNLFFLFLPT